MIFSEDSWVKIPCILHMVRLGYSYLSLKDAVWDLDTNNLQQNQQLAQLRDWLLPLLMNGQVKVA